MDQTIIAAISPYLEQISNLARQAEQHPSDLGCFLNWACRTNLDAPTERPEKRGERVVLWTAADGMRGLETVLRLKKEAWERSVPFHCIISGGELGYFERDNLCGLYMAQMTMIECLARGLPWVPNEFTVDAFSKHTGHQGRVLPAMLGAMGAKTVDLVAPIFHLPRFALTIGYGCKAAGLNNLRFLPQPFGTWETRHAAKMPRRVDAKFDATTQGFTYAELAFATLPPFARENPDSIAENTSEIQKIFEGMEHVAARTGKKLMCYHLRLEEATQFFRID